MHPPTTAVAWEVWRQHRWVLMAAIAWLLTLSGVCHALSDGVLFGVQLFAHDDAILLLLLLAVSPLICGLVPLFVYAVDADLVGRESGFPKRMLTLPLSSRALAGWPMLYGTATIALAWLAVAALILQTRGVNVHLWWPAALLAGTLAWVQAIAWRPFGLPGLRIVAAAAAVGLLVAISGLRWMARLPEPLVALALVASILPAYMTAVAGVARARRGDQPDWQWLIAPARAVAGWCTSRGRSVASPSGAQVWFEWRRGGLGFPITAALIILFLVVFVLVNRHNPRHAPGSPFRSPLLLLVVPLLVGGALGGGSWGICGDSHGKRAIPAFLATRPMTCAGLVWAKMKAAAIGAAAVWAMTLATVVLMVVATGCWPELAGQWAAATQALSPLKTAALVALGVALLPIATWRSMIASMYIGLAGRKWVECAAVFLLVQPAAAALLLGLCLFWQPEYHGDFLAALPSLLASAAVLKVSLAGWAVRALVRRRLVPARLLVRLLAGWLATGACLVGLFYWLAPGGLAPWHAVVSCVVLALPLLRLSLAPLALAWNRHR